MAHDGDNAAARSEDPGPPLLAGDEVQQVVPVGRTCSGLSSVRRDTAIAPDGRLLSTTIEAAALSVNGPGPQLRSYDRRADKLYLSWIALVAGGGVGVPPVAVRVGSPASDRLGPAPLRGRPRIPIPPTTVGAVDRSDHVHNGATLPP